MDDESSNSVAMIDATFTFCRGNQTPTNGIGAFNGIRIQGEDKLTLVRALEVVIEGGSDGATGSMHDVRKVVERLSYRLCNAVAADAYIRHDLELEAANSHNKSDLEKMKKETIVSIGTQVHADAVLHFATAGAYGFINTDMTDLGVALGLLEAKLMTPQVKIAYINSSKVEMKRLIAEIKETILVKLMDRMVNTIIDSQKVFYKAYATVRGINDLGGHHGKVGGTTVDINDNDMDGVAFTAKTHGTDTVVGSDISAHGAKYSAHDILPQNLDLTWVKPGFHTVSKVNVHLGPGKSLRYKITMLPIVV